MMNFADAQRDMRFGYFAGAPGMAASACAWLIAGVVALQGAPAKAVLALFIGGMLIHPVAVLVAKALGRPGAHTQGNPLGRLALESTGWMLLCLPLAYAISLHRMEWFFPAMLLVIGGRYLVFSTLYGLRLYRVCGGTLVVVAWLLSASGASVPTGAFAGAAIEAVFAALLFAMARRERFDVGAVAAGSPEQVAIAAPLPVAAEAGAGADAESQV